MAKGKGNQKAKRKAQVGSSKTQDTSAGPANPQIIQCRTLDEDEITSCGKPATQGYPQVERCKVHHAQYRTMYVKYKEASKIVDDTKGERAFPTKEQINRSTDVHSLLKKARWMRKYLEAVRVEKSGREIHSRRFFLKVDDGHKQRMKILEKQMVAAVEILDALQSRAFNLRVADDQAYEWIKEFQAADDLGDNNKDLLSTKNVVDHAQPPRRGATVLSQSGRLQPPAQTTDATVASAAYSDADDVDGGSQDLDLIDIELRRQKNRLLYGLELLLYPPANPIDNNPAVARQASMLHHTCLQYARRAVFHEPVLSLKALDKVSFKDLFLDEDFSVEDAARLAIMFQKRLEIGLLWWKDSVREAMAIVSKAGTAANVSNPKNRFKILGSWIFNTAHTGTLSNEAWWSIIQALKPPADVENRFVRLCNNFDDMIGFLSFGALGMIPPPNFCRNEDPSRDCVAYRNHLTLSGVVVSDMVSSRAPPIPCPTRQPAKRRGCVVWAQAEMRAYMFGAVRNEPDNFTDAFLNELRGRPDLFQVVTRSDTDPARQVEAFGGPIPGEAMPQARTRKFEAPLTLANLPDGHGEWDVMRSAIDVLYGTKLIDGYLVSLNRPGSAGWFFHFKKMPVKYFVVLDSTPGRHVSFLAREVAWAALRAQHMATGEYEQRKYARASDVLFQKRAEERLAWMPEGLGGWSATKMEDQL